MNLLKEKADRWGHVSSNAIGSHITFSLDDCISDKAIAAKAFERKHEFIACSSFDGDYQINGLMLGFGAFPTPTIAESVFVKILQKNWLGVFLSLKNLSRGFAPTLRYPRIFF